MKPTRVADPAVSTDVAPEATRPWADAACFTAARLRLLVADGEGLGERVPVADGDGPADPDALGPAGELPVGEGLAVVGEGLALVGDGLAVVGDGLAVVGDGLALVGDGLGDGEPLGGQRMPSRQLGPGCGAAAAAGCVPLAPSTPAASATGSAVNASSRRISSPPVPRSVPHSAPRCNRP